MKKFEKLTFENDTLKNAVKLALNNKYRVFIFQADKIGVVIIENKDKKLCNIDAYFGMVNTGSVHKANRNCGTGFSIERELCDININHIDNACNTFCPNWSQSSFKHVKKYDSIEDYLKRDAFLKFNEIIL